MCGSESGLFKAEIEGTILTVCKNCSKYGKVISSISDPRYVQKKKKRSAVEPYSKDQMLQAVVEDFAKRIKEKRESLDLKQEDFAKNINEKVSLVHKIETGHFEPNISLARKIEKFLKISLIEQVSGSKPLTEKTKSDTFTLGDFIKVK